MQFVPWPRWFDGDGASRPGFDQRAKEKVRLRIDTDGMKPKEELHIEKS
jgi:hypothetical protein